MTHSFDIQFDPDPSIKNVDFAVVPIDAFTGRIVTSALQVRLKNLPNHPIRNLSGMHVFVNLPNQLTYQVEVFPLKVGYFEPGVKIWPVPNDLESKTSKRLIVPLFKKPGTGVDTDITTVSGVVVRGSQALESVIIRAFPPTNALFPGSISEPFETRSDKRGAFALRLRVPTKSDGEVKFKFQYGAFQREIEEPVEEGKFYSFREPIDMIGSNVPQLLAFGG